ncbi:MAG: FAD-binding oxidoreductase [Nanoarchaeota archaeon]|nr:FAD-binding oxidoreductase [Nanoarchaeota archaeon]
MVDHIVKILNTKQITDNVKSFLVEKPNNFNFIPGQAVDLSINLPDYKNEKRPFTFTSLNEYSNLEFTIKIYNERNGVTKKLGELQNGSELILSDPFGAIQYKGKGVFLAGGAGITPFIAILRQLKKDKALKGNTLIFSNKTEKDIILKEEFDQMKKEGLEVIYTLTRELNSKYENKRIDEDFLKQKINNFNQNFYICGPIRFVGELTSILIKLGANPDSVIVET